MAKFCLSSSLCSSIVFVERHWSWNEIFLIFLSLSLLHLYNPIVLFKCISHSLVLSNLRVCVHYHDHLFFRFLFNLSVKTFQVLELIKTIQNNSSVLLNIFLFSPLLSIYSAIYLHAIFNSSSTISSNVTIYFVRFVASTSLRIDERLTLFFKFFLSLKKKKRKTNQFLRFQFFLFFI